MSAHRISFRWSAKAEGGSAGAAAGLAERLRALSEDRAAHAQELVRETAGLLRSWVVERPRDWGQDAIAAGAELETGLAEWNRSQSWRGSCATFVHHLRGSFAALRGTHELREGLADELGEWSQTPHPRGGHALELEHSKLPSPRDVVPHALRLIERGDEILVHGRSEVLIECLAAAQNAGLAPRVTLAVGGADQSGKRSARQLANQGIPVRLIWDAALTSAVCAADQVWLGTEGVGPAAFLSLLGSGAVLAEARRLEIPARVLCTSDVCLPGSQMELPAWAADESWNLWSQAPESVQLEAQPFEINDADGVTGWLTEEGPTDLVTLCTRHLVTEPADPCGPLLPPEHNPLPGDVQHGR